LSDGNPNPNPENVKPFSQNPARSRLTRVLQLRIPMGNMGF
jgi:hypothetical protein